MKNFLIIPLLGLAFLCHCQTIIDINNTTNTGSDASNLTVFADKVFLSADDGVNGMGLYSMDNNSSPTRLSPGSYEDPKEFTVLDDRLYFTSGPFQSRQLFYIENSNPSLIFEIDNTLGDPAEMISHNGIHYLVNGDEVLMIEPNDDQAVSIGSTNGDLIAKGMPNSTDMTRKYIFVASNKLFFNTASGIYYVDLLLNSGAELVNNSDNYEYGLGGDYVGYYIDTKVVYRTKGGIGFDSELLLIDAANSTPTANFINLSPATSSIPTFFIQSQGLLFFTAFSDTENMNVVWYIDGNASTIANFNYIPVQSAQTILSGASNDPFITVDGELFHFRNKITVTGGVPNISNTEECFDYPYFNHQVMNYGGDYYYIGCCFDLFRCNGTTPEKLTCVGGIDNAIGKFVLLDDKFYLSSLTLPNYGIELLRWPEDQGDGICSTDCCGDAKVIGDVNDAGGGIFKEVYGVRLLLSTTNLWGDTYAVVSKVDANNDVAWSRRITEASQFLDFTINDDGNIIVIGRTTPVSVGLTNQCIMGIINSSTGAVISMKKHEFFGRQTFSKILKHNNPIDATFPYYIIGVENGTMNNTNANDDVIILNVGEQLQVNWSAKYIKSNDNQWSRDIIGLSNGNILVIGDEDGIKGMFVTIHGSTGDVISVMETTDNRSFSEIIEVAGGNFVSVGRSGAFTLNNGMLCYHNNDLSMIDAIHFDGAIKLFYSVIETSPGTFIAAGTLLDDKPVLVEFTIPAGTIQIQNIKYLDHDGDASSRAYVNYVNGQLLYTESVQTHPMGFGGQDLYFASLNADLSDDCLVDTMFNTVSDAFVLSSQTTMKELIVVDVGQNMAIGIFDYDQNDACQSVSTSDIPDILEIKIYPNPSNGLFSIESDDILNATISIYNITGQQITTITPTQEKVTLDLSDQRTGLYLIQVRSENGDISTHKVIVAN